MGNGGSDNCHQCGFAVPIGDERAHCRIRDIDIDNPYWTYCANALATNPDQVEVPVGPVYVDSGDDPYRRVIHVPAPSGLVRERLDLLERAARGDLDPRTRNLQVAVIQDLAREGVAEALPHLVELALAEPADLTPAGFPGPGAGAFDLSYWWEMDAVRVEFVRLAALRALRQINTDVPSSDVVLELTRRLYGASPDLAIRINVAIAFALDVLDPP